MVCVSEGLPGDYRMPFEDEVGIHPTLEEMQDAVVSSRKRPQFKQHWLKNEVFTHISSMRTVHRCGYGCSVAWSHP